MLRKSAFAEFDSLSLLQLLSLLIDPLCLLIEEILSRQDLEDCTPAPRPEAPPPTSQVAALDETFFTISQVAERLNLSDRQVRYAISKGLIESNRFEGKGPGAIRVPGHSITAYIQRCKISPRLQAPVKGSLPKGKPFKHLKLSGPEGGGSSLGS